ncbi:TolC family protein [Vibrio lentus]|nr:TolC family protein [Vibrio lentus]
MIRERLLAKQLNQTEQRFAVGSAPITDVQDAQAQYDNVVAQEIQAQEFGRKRFGRSTSDYRTACFKPFCS